MKNNIFTIATLILVSLWACNQADPVCPDTQAYDFKLLLKKVADSTSTRIMIYNPDADTIDTEKNFPELVSIPVNINEDSTIFYIDFINDTAPEFNVTDIISFSHTDSLYVNSQECGYIMEFTITNVLCGYTHIDSVYPINIKINEDNVGNIKIYY